MADIGTFSLDLETQQIHGLGQHSDSISAMNWSTERSASLVLRFYILMC